MTALDTDRPRGRIALQGAAASPPVWSPAGAGVAVDPGGAISHRDARTGATQRLPTADVPRVTRRPRSGVVVALFLFYCLQLGSAVVAWWQALIRTEALVDPVIAYSICVVLMVPALALRGRWRAIPTTLATVLGAVAPLWLVRDLISIVGPRDVWVGQSLTLQVFFPLVIGVGAVVALLSAPRRVAAHLDP